MTDPQIAEISAAACARHGFRPDALVQVLHAVQDALGYIPDEALSEVASGLRIPRVQVQGTRDFYTFFLDRPGGRYRVLFSNNITDWLQGCEEYKDLLCRKLLVEGDRVSEDGLVYVGSTSCIGMSDQGPAALVNGRPVTRIDTARIEEMAELIRSETPLARWPEAWFVVEDNIRRGGLLLENALDAGESLRAALAKGSDGVLAELELSGLRGRGGAGFPTFMKWKFCRQAQATDHYVVCNADEGEPGTFKDRVLLHRYADAVFEGMTVCGRVIGARHGYLYLREEYRYLLPGLEQVLARRRTEGLLGEAILGADGFDFDIHIHLGAGAYICGEESALIESLEGKRGVPRNRPPFPVTHGYLGQPTVVNNVETFLAAAHVVAKGGNWFAAIGTEKSKGSKILSIAGDCARPGIYEYPYGVTMAEIAADCGAGDVKAIQVGGPSGTLIGAGSLQRRLGFEDLATGGSFMVFNSQRDMFALAWNFAHFFAHESCGFCTPCRVGTSLMARSMDKIAAGHGTRLDLGELGSLGELTHRMSHCGLGQTAANPVLHAMQIFPADFEGRLRSKEFEPAFDLDRALAQARRITGRDDRAAHILPEKS